jgi:penicillin G amidase
MLKRLTFGRLVLRAAVLMLSLSLASCAASRYLGYKMSPDYPEDKNETIKLEGLSSAAKVYLDSYGIPHIEAANEMDLMRAIGFVHGRTRFFQMDTIRRYARGRLSELVGNQNVPLGTTADLDASMRGWGFEKASQAEADSLPPQAAELMGAYVQGINAALKLYTPIEYRLLGVDPEPWTVADSFSVAYMIAWGITHNWRQELSRVLISAHVGVERASKIYPHTAWPGGTALPPNAEKHDLPPAVVPEVLEFFPDRSYEQLRASEKVAAQTEIAGSDDIADGLWPGKSIFGWASNGWVVGPGRSASGGPILANDPHLPHMLPSIMFQQHLRCDDLDVIGASVPGLPLVLTGHNREVAWGLTSAVADAIDLYIEKIDPNDPNMVLGPDGPEPLTKAEIVIKIRDGDDLEEIKRTIRKTKRGPLINDLYPHVLPAWAPLVSVHAGSLGAGKSILSLRKANRAKTVKELREAMLGMASPINTVMAADKTGQITLFATGRVPKRTAHRGTFPAPAWVKTYQWDALISDSEMPLGLGGDSDYFAHGNTLMYDPEQSDVLFQIDSAPSYRKDRIAEMIEQTEKHTVESMAKIQGDAVLHRGRSLAPQVIEAISQMADRNPLEEKAYKLLTKWDHQALADSAATAIFFVTYREMIIEAMQDEVGQKGVKYLLAQRYFSNAVDRWFPQADHVVWDNRATSQREQRPAVIQIAFRRAVAWLNEKLDDEPEEWHWGKIHDMKFNHAFGKKTAAFNLESVGAPGSIAAVWKAHFDLGHPETPFRANYGPVYRMIVDLSDVEHAWWILDTGSSGWPCTPHYADQFPIWRKNELIPMLMNWDEIHKTSKFVITLE